MKRIVCFYVVAVVVLLLSVAAEAGEFKTLKAIKGNKEALHQYHVEILEVIQDGSYYVEVSVRNAETSKIKEKKVYLDPSGSKTKIFQDFDISYPNIEYIVLWYDVD